MPILAQDLRNAVLQAAMQGKLTEQLDTDSEAKEILKNKNKIFSIKNIKVPTNWVLTNIENVFDVKMGQSPKGNTINKNSTGVEFHQGKIYFGDKYLNNSDFYTTSPTKIVEKDTVLLCVRAPIGVINITKKEICIGRGLCGIQRDIIPLDFIYYLFCYLKPILIKKGTGSTFKAINNKIIKSQMILLPPLEEQKRIVDKLNEIMPLIDEYEKIEKQLVELKKEFPEDMKNAILQAAMQGKLTEQLDSDSSVDELLINIEQEKNELIKQKNIKKEKPLALINDYEIPFNIPDNWKWVRLNDIGNWKAGATPLKSNLNYYRNGTIPWLLTGDLNDNYIYDVPNKITQLALENTSTKLNPIGSVLIAMYGATIGKLGILTFESTTNQACCACNPFKGIHNKYLFYFLMQHRNEFIKQGAGSGQPNISREKIIKTLIPIPSIEEQQRIVKKLDQLLPLCDSLSEMC